LVTFVQASYLKTDMLKFESSQSHESRAQTADSSKTCSKPGPFNCWLRVDV